LTPVKRYYVPIIMGESQSGHNTDSDFTETITRFIYYIFC